LQTYLDNGGTELDYENAVKANLKARGGLSGGSIDGAQIIDKNNLQKVGLKNDKPTTGDIKIRLEEGGPEYTASFRYASYAKSGVKDS
jgi:hypothetical protein